MPGNRNNTVEQIDKAADLGRKASEEAARSVFNVADDTTRTIGNLADEASKAGEQASRSGSDITRRGLETVQETLQSGLGTTVQTLKQMTDQFTQALGFAGPQAEELACRSSQNFDAALQASTVLAKGAQEISQEWLRLVQDRLAKNPDVLNRFAGCRSVQDFVAIQSDVARDRLGQAVESSRRIAEVSMRAADEAARIIQAQTGRSATKFDRNAERVRQTA